MNSKLPTVLSGLSRALFPTTLVEIAVYKLGSKVERVGQFEQLMQVSALCNQ